MTQQFSPKRFRGRGKNSFWSANPQDCLDRFGIVFQTEVQNRTLTDFQTYLEKRKPLLLHPMTHASALYAIVSRSAISLLRTQATTNRDALKVSVTAPIDPQKKLDCQWLEDNRTRLPLPDFFRSLIDTRQHQHSLYLFREGKTVLYVGESGKHPGTRPAEHLRSEQSFGKLYRVNMDLALSFSWTGEVLTLAECESFIIDAICLSRYDNKSIQAEFIRKYRTDQSWARMIAERVLIWALRPCCNTEGNPFPTPIPDHLYRLSGTDEAMVLIPPASRQVLDNL